LGATRFDAEISAGRALGRDAAIELALGERPEAVHGPTTPDAAPLAPREAEIARLVAEGLTNREIGARLFISERTVDAHVCHILDKLDAASRAQIAGWVRATLG
jgi:DNA-binding NarL/FixJ family response regulator